jgi:hypothetical protein
MDDPDSVAAAPPAAGPHLYRCPTCGAMIDPRDLGAALYHARAAHRFDQAHAARPAGDDAKGTSHGPVTDHGGPDRPARPRGLLTRRVGN